MSNRSDFYRGQTAENYDAQRAGSRTWDREQTIVEELLREADLPDGTQVADAPVGTGRFASLYDKLGLCLFGVDISEAMLAQAIEHSSKESHFVRADMTAMPIGTNRVDAAVCIRFVHLVDRKVLGRAVTELGRIVAPGGTLIIGARLEHWKVRTDEKVRVAQILRRRRRVLRFRLGSANSRPHSERLLMRALARAGFELRERKRVTHYPDGSYYSIFALRSTFTPALPSAPTVELFGLPGAGKTTLAMSLLSGSDMEIKDGFSAIEPSSLVQCVRRRPLAALRLLGRLLPVVVELRHLAARQVVMSALRQRSVDRTHGSVTLFQEGVSHEIWRQLVSGRELSDAFIQRILPVADLTVLVEVDRVVLARRLHSKPSPGPISRMLRDEPTSAAAWDQAAIAYERIKMALQSRGATIHVVENNATILEGASKVGRLISST